MPGRSFVFLSCLLAVTCTGRTSESVAVSRYDVAVAILPDGSLTVTEDIEAAGTGTSSRFVRELRSSKIDSITDAVASLDGRDIHLVGGRLETAGDALLLNVPIASGAHRLHLTYHARGVLLVQEPRATLAWEVFPRNRSYPIQSSTVTLALPAGTGLIGHPSLAGRGLPLTLTTGGLAADITSIQTSEVTMLSAELDVAGLHIEEPVWQAHLTQARNLMPAFVAAGVCLLVVGGGILTMMRLQYPTVRIVNPSHESRDSTLPPTLVGALLRSQFRCDRPLCASAVLDLVRDGAVSMSETGALSLAHTPTPDAERTTISYRRAAVGILWPDRVRVAPVPLDAAVSRLERRRHSFAQALRADLVTAGAIDPERLAAVRGLRFAAVVTAVLGIAFGTVVIVAFQRYGIWPHAMTIGLMIVAALFGLAATRLDLLTPTGQMEREHWTGLLADGRRESHVDWLALAVACRVPYVPDAARPDARLPFVESSGLLP